MGASHQHFSNEGPNAVTRTTLSRSAPPVLCVFNSLFPGVGLLPAVGAQRGDREPDGPWGQLPHPTRPRAPRTHRNLVCWSLWAPAICLYTSFSCQAREGCEAGALGQPRPRATQAQRTSQGGLGAHPWACRLPVPCRERSQGADPRTTACQAHVRGSPFLPRINPAPMAAPRGSPARLPRPEMPAAPSALTFSSTSWRSWSHSRVSGFSRFSVQRRARRRDSP